MLKEEIRTNSTSAFVINKMNRMKQMKNTQKHSSCLFSVRIFIKRQQNVHSALSSVSRTVSQWETLIMIDKLPTLVLMFTDGEAQLSLSTQVKSR